MDDAPLLSSRRRRQGGGAETGREGAAAGDANKANRDSQSACEMSRDTGGGGGRCFSPGSMKNPAKGEGRLVGLVAERWERDGKGVGMGG